MVTAAEPLNRREHFGSPTLELTPAEELRRMPTFEHGDLTIRRTTAGASA
ncbi:MAG: hypothetical protein M3N53_08640 [Actinomycetota bacterium]|nr:hypothetical protein [Actinomycetota bacterium]